MMLEGQQLHVKTKSLEFSSELGNELRVHHAFIRRELALDMANLASYGMHERVMREFMSHLTRAAPMGFRGLQFFILRRFCLRVSTVVRTWPFSFRSFGWILSEETDKNSVQRTVWSPGSAFDMREVSQGVLRARTLRSVARS